MNETAQASGPRGLGDLVKRIGFRPAFAGDGTAWGHFAHASLRPTDAAQLVGEASLWVDFAMVKAATNAIQRGASTPLLALSVSATTLRVAAGKYSREIERLASGGVQIAVTLAGRTSNYDGAAILKFATLCHRKGVLIGIALHAETWEADLRIARALGANYLTVRGADLQATSVRQQILELALAGETVLVCSIRDERCKIAALSAGAVAVEGSALAKLRRTFSAGGQVTQRTAVRTKVAAAVAGALLAACASVPSPVVPDGSNRTPVNDPARIARLQTASTQQMQVVAERSALMSEVSTLKRQIDDLRNVLQLMLAMPDQEPAPVGLMAPAQTSRTTPAPAEPGAVLKVVPKQAQSIPSSSTAASAPATPSATTSSPVSVPAPKAVSEPTTKPAVAAGEHAVQVVDGGVVFRVFHASGSAAFEPTTHISEALLAAARGADAIEVQGRTDSGVVTEGNTAVAIARAVEARRWLVAQGVDSTKIRARYSSAGRFLTTDTSEEGKALNRRVEIRIRGDVAKSVALLNIKQG